MEHVAQKHPRFRHAQEIMVRIAFRTFGVKGQRKKKRNFTPAITLLPVRTLARAHPICKQKIAMSKRKRESKKKPRIEDSDDDVTWAERMEDNKPLFPGENPHSMKDDSHLKPVSLSHPEVNHTRNLCFEDSDDDVPIFAKKKI